MVSLGKRSKEVFSKVIDQSAHLSSSFSLNIMFINTTLCEDM